jgi:hypothetical protein
MSRLASEEVLMKHGWPFVSLLLVVLLSACSQSLAVKPGIISAQDFGTSEGDGAFAVAAASTNHIYVTGITTGELHGENNGSQDGFLRRYDSHGDPLWGRQIHSRFTEFANDVSASTDGDNAYVVGATEGSLAGSRGGFDAFIRRYNEKGREVWTRQFGTAKGDFGLSVFADEASNIYVAGGTFGNLARANKGENDAFIRKYTPNATTLWTRQFGTSGADFMNSLTVDAAGSVYVAGNTTGSLDGSTPTGRDAFIRKYSSSGAVQWTKQIDLSDSDDIASLVSYGDNVYALGTYADNDQDVFMYKYTAAGRLVWKRFISTSSIDETGKVRVDGQGSVYVSGQTEGALRGSNRGCSDAFVRKYSRGGSVVWTRQFGTSGCDAAFGLATRGTDELYVAGYSDPSLDGRPTAGGDDAYLRRLDPTDGSTLWTDQ